MTTLITGGQGCLAKELAKVFPDVYAPSHKEMDVAYKDGVAWQLAEKKPDIIIHAAALTGVTTCDSRRLLAYDTNVVGTSNMITMAHRYCPQSKFIYISTPCVFDGDDGNYDEYSTRAPENYYGYTKMWAEDIVRNSYNSLIIRTNFVGREKWKHPKAFIDRFGTYLFADDAAKAIYDIVVNKMAYGGVIHAVGDREMSMYELAKLTNPDVEPTTMADYHGPPLTRDMTLISKRVAPYRLTV